MKTLLLVLLMIPCVSYSQKIRNMAPSWSPDGTMIAYYSSRDGNDEIYITDSLGSKHRRVTHNETSDVLPKFSPDGKKLVFFSGEEGNHQIFTININGGELTQITNTIANNEDPSWSKDGNSIIFNSDKTGNHELYMLNINEQKEEKLTLDELSRDFTGEMSPDGKKIAFVKTFSQDSTGIFILDILSGTYTKLTSFNLEYTPTWSPDGSMMFFMHRDKNNDIFSWDIKKQKAERLTDHEAHDIFPSCSPDGKKIAFSSKRDTGNYELYIIDIESRKVKRLTFDSTKKKK